MGEVFLGQRKRGPMAAVKLLRADLASDTQFRARFRREVQVALRVEGFCTAKILDADVDAKRPWLAAEYVEGPTLLQYVRDHDALPEPQLQALALGLLEALHAIHAAGVVHRDYTPSNVLLSQHGPKVVDFGIAQPMEATALTATGAVIGTPAWMAPEQVQGLGHSPATDIFAWGLLVAYAATGRSPFGTGRMEAVIHRIVYDAPDVTGLSEPLRGQVLRCLNKDPSARPTIQELVSELVNRDAPTQLESITEQTLLAEWTIPFAIEPAVPRRRPSRGTVLTTAAIIVVLATAGVVLLFASQPSTHDAALDASVTTATSGLAATAPAAATTTITTAPPTTAPPTTTPAPAPPSDSASPVDAVEAWLANQGHTSAGSCDATDPSRDIGKWCYSLKDDGTTTKTYDAGLTFAEADVILSIQRQTDGGWLVTGTQQIPPLGSS
jgi:serine/threonine protein kinase